MRPRVHLAAVAFGIMLSASSLAAHHSYTEYDMTKAVTVKGIVSKVEWANPHVRLYVDARDASGTLTTWNFEMANTLALQRNGWSRKTLQVGFEVTVGGFSSRDGVPRAIARSIVTADGKSLFVGKPGE